MIILHWIWGFLLLILFGTMAYISLREKEKRASAILLFTGIAASVFFFGLSLLPFSANSPVRWFFNFLPAGFLILLLPVGRRKQAPEAVITQQIDERDTMFSRQELTPGSDRYQEYYRAHPEALEADNRWRSNPGLLSPAASLSHPYGFPAANAQFRAVKALHPLVEKPVDAPPQEVNPEETSTFLKKWAIHLGAHSAGITLLKKHHLYHTGGRGDRYGKKYRPEHKYALAITVEMNFEMVKGAPRTPIVMESARQYFESGKIAVILAEWIRSMGYEARAHIDGNYQVVCPLVARDAGLGEIGRMGLLMTPRLGPRVRISVVTTNMPLLTDTPLHDSSVYDFCLRCKKCADACPGKAISGTEPENINGTVRWQIDQVKCYTVWTRFGTDCGRCVAVCPYAHADNPMHAMVRRFIRVSPLFTRFAVLADDLLYGRTPSPAALPDWIPGQKHQN
ncbi:MAG: hypothetical protein Kow00127_07880 [Bacteroidales bacterium]